MVNIIDGKKLSEEILIDCKNQIEKLGKNNRKPSLVVITIGEDQASKIYVKNKQKACEACGILFKNEVLEVDVSKQEVLKKIEELNQDNSIDGILLQLPIPKHLEGIEQNIDIKKDVDGINIYNLGSLLYKNIIKQIKPCTPSSIMYMLEKYSINLEGKHVVIIGRSNIVGKPLIGMLLNKNATVTSCNSYTENLNEITKTANIIISAIGKGKIINREYISEKTDVIIDAGISRDKNGKICGDIDFQNIMEYWKNTQKEKYITPVPGGVGPVTVASLIKNVIECYKKI